MGLRLQAGVGLRVVLTTCSVLLDNTHKEKHVINLVRVKQKELVSHVTVALFLGLEDEGGT